MTTTTLSIAAAADWYERELQFAIDAHEFTPELRDHVERILGWNAEKVVNIETVWAQRLTEAAQLIAETRR